MGADDTRAAAGIGDSLACKDCDILEVSTHQFPPTILDKDGGERRIRDGCVVDAG